MKKEDGAFVCDLLLLAGGLYGIYVMLAKGEGRRGPQKWVSLFMLVMNAVKTALSGKLRDGMPAAVWSGLFLLNAVSSKAEKE